LKCIRSSELFRPPIVKQAEARASPFKRRFHGQLWLLSMFIGVHPWLIPFFVSGGRRASTILWIPEPP
jgi:hypothetical protein